MPHELQVDKLVFLLCTLTPSAPLTVTESFFRERNIVFRNSVFKKRA